MTGLLTRKEAAVYLGVSVSWLARRHPDRPAVFRFAGKVRYRTADLDAWIEAHREDAGCPSTPTRDQSTTGAGSTCADMSSVSALARQIAERLRAKSDGSEQREKLRPPPLQLVQPEE